MAISKTIQIKRGQEADLSSLSLLPGELAFTLDTGKLYVGDGIGKILINANRKTLIDEDNKGRTSSK